MIFTYFVGSYWYIFSLTIDHLNLDNHDREDLDSFAFYNENWDIKSQTSARQSLISMYFAFTSLSTVGFGDYYPVSDTERLCGSIILLSGVAMFSYILESFMAQINEMKKINEPFGDQRKLDKFFNVLQDFNFQNPIDKKI